MVFFVGFWREPCRGGGRERSKETIGNFVLRNFSTERSKEDELRKNLGEVSEGYVVTLSRILPVW